MQPFADDLPSRQRQEWWGLALLLIGVAVFLVALRWSAFEQRDAAERERLEGQGRAMQQILGQQLEAAYGALLGIRDELTEWTPDNMAAAGSRRLKALADALPGVTSTMLLDARGRVRAASLPMLIDQDFAPLLQAATDPDLLYALPPQRDASGVVVLRLVLPVAAPAGGALVVTLDPDYFRVVLHSVLYAPDMRAALAHFRGGVLMFEPPQPGSDGLNVAVPDSFFEQHRASGHAADVYSGPVVMGGPPRLVELRSLKPADVPLDGPLVLTLSRELRAVRAPWREQTAINVVLYLLLAAGMAGLLALMQRRQRQSARRERAEFERLTLALRGADLGSWDHDFRTGHGSVNARWSEMLGAAPGEVASDAAGWRALLHPEDRARVLAALQAHVDGSSDSYEAVYRMQHRGGHWVWILDRGKVIERAPGGEPLRMAGTHMDITARTEAEQALRRSEESLSITLHSIGDAVIATDAAGCITRINATAERLTGWPKADALGRPLQQVFRIFNPHTGAAVNNPVQAVLERGEVIGLANDTLLEGRHGVAVQIADSAAPIRTADGRITGVVLVFSDVSERYRAQQALRERERQLSIITDALPGPVSRSDRSGRYLFANAAYETWFGKASADVIGRTLLDVLGPRRLAGIQPFVDRVLAGETVRGEYALRTVDGQRRHSLVTLLPDRDAEGHVNGVFTIIVDISDRKRAEDALRASERKSRELLEHLLTGVTVHGPDARVLDANPAACRILGLTLAQMRSSVPVEPPLNFIEEDDTPLPPERFPVAQVLASGEPMSGQVFGIVRAPLAQTLWVLCTAFPVHGADGALTQIVVTFIDISERKAAEAERRLLEQQLREAQKMESIGTLAGGIAHDFNNILAAILGNAALACEDAGADAAVQSSLAQIQKAGLRARSLVQQILTFSRREPGALAVQPLRPVVEETLSLLRATLPAAVQLQAVLPAQTVAVRADATQLQQVLMNLVTNAWHALPAAGGRVEIGFDVVADGHAVHLWVRDNGCGMDEATVARVFDPFFTTKPVGRGTGLGLSVVHGIVRAHHGSIEVTSAPGSGSSFDVYLPTPEHADAAALPRVPGGSAPGHGEHVLLVDDDEVVLVMAERLLQRAGYRVTPVGSARAALQKLQAQPLDFDVVVTDFNMPESSGIELARRVAELRRGLPVVLSSGLVSEELREQARRAGVRAVMKKENSFEELAATVARVLATQR
jgi:PAS domain S-box-containing protein